MKKRRIASKKRTQGQAHSQPDAYTTFRGQEKMERAQIWSIDVLLAVVIFISIMIIFYVTINAKETPSLKDLQTEAKFIDAELEKNEGIAFIENDVVDSAKLDAFTQEASVNYDDVKEELGIVGDFCIYFEDENGYLIVLEDNRTGIGTGELVNISDVPCGTPMP
ncbi:hypothetical protein JW826_03515 [Candidatus Woesearchaeota archaeon]|nr:hypothetical protein [Candidatus Woesearchaeota archaeon]